MSSPAPGLPERPVADEERTVLANLAFELRAGIERTKRLMGSFEAGGLDDVGRAEAREGARYLAVEGRIGFIRLGQLIERVPDEFPAYAGALRGGTRLAYCLLALAGDDPEPLALIPCTEIDTLFRDEGAEEWLQTMWPLLPKDGRR